MLWFLLGMLFLVGVFAVGICFDLDYVFDTLAILGLLSILFSLIVIIVVGIWQTFGWGV